MRWRQVSDKPVPDKRLLTQANRDQVVSHLALFGCCGSPLASCALDVLARGP